MTPNLHPHEPGLRAGWVHMPAEPFDIRGYLARPDNDDSVPVVVTAHENLGITEHRQRVTRQVAEAGLACLTVDLFSRIGGIPPQDFSNAEERRAKAFLAARDEQAVPDLRTGLDYLATVDGLDTGRSAALGFCLGGGTVMALATTATPLRCVVSLYGIPILPPEYSPTGEERSRIELLPALTAPIQFHFGDNDEAIPRDQVDALEAALPSCPHPAELYRYAGAGHAYHDDTHPNHHAEAARLTWERTLSFLRKYLN